MKRTLKAILLGAILVLFSSSGVKATHLVGGNIGYNYLGETAPGSQMYRYEVYLEFFMNCGPQSNWQTFYQLLGQNYNTPLEIGVYIQDPMDPNADKVKYQNMQVYFNDSTVIEPDLPDNCVIGQGLCTVKGRFIGTVDLPINFGGYHLYYQMCCRNLDIDNLLNPNGTGIGYYAYIPPTLVNNSSPQFLGVPTPFLCTSDTTTFLNTAVDPDGDQLIFSFERPYNSSGFGGGIIPPPLQLQWPVPEVTHAAGFSTNQPFGAGGYSFINGATGLTQYLSPQQGNFVVAVEVKEYRNGVLIGRVRRDLQLQVIACPPNTTPAVVPPAITAFSVQAGATLCFDMQFQDLDGDSLELVADGSIFDGGIFMPPATIGSPVLGAGLVNSQFCWNTACDQGQSQPYLFSVSVTDNGCPPKTVDMVYQVQVIPFNGPTSITGPLQACVGATGLSYSTSAIPGATFDWSIVGGTITSGGTTNSITVDWMNAGAGVVTVSATDSLGCMSAVVDLDVTVVPLPVTDAGFDQQLCAGSSVALGGQPTGPAGSTFTWSPSTGLSSTNIANPIASPQQTTSYVVSVSNAGCANTDTVIVTVLSSSVNAGSDATICSGDTTQLAASGGLQYLWSPPLGLSDVMIADPLAFPTSTTAYAVTVLDTNNCSAVDTVVVTVLDLPIIDVGPDSIVCPDDVIVLGGSPTGPPGSTYAWSPAALLNDSTLASPTATILAETTFTVFVTDMNGCSDTASVNYFVATPPFTNAGPDLVICPDDSVQLQGQGIGAIAWQPSSSLSNSGILDPWATPDTTTTYTLTIDNGGSCVGTDMVTVTVANAANANAGTDVGLCAGDSIQLSASGGMMFLWTPAFGLSDANSANPLAFPTATTEYVVQVTTVNNCVDTDTIVVNVQQPVSSGEGTILQVCGGDAPVDLFALLSGAPDANGTWSPADTYFPGSGGGVFTYVVQGVSPCVNDTATIIILESPSANAGPDLAFCEGDTVTLSATGEGTFLWTPGNSLSDVNSPTPLAFPAITTTYTVTVTDSIGCITSDSLVVTVNATPVVDAGNDDTVCAFSDVILGGNPTGPPGSTYLWLPTSGLDDPNLEAPTASPSITTTYVVSVMDPNGCNGQDSITISVQPLPTVDAGADLDLCAGTATQLNASGNGTFSWSPTDGLSDAGINDPTASPVQTTTYVVTLTDSVGCIATDDVTITVLTLPTVLAGPDVWVCPGFDVPISASGAISYAWTPVTGLDDPNSATPNASPPSTTTYTVTGTDANGCEGSDQLTVSVNDDPPIDAGPDQTICGGDPVMIGGSPSSIPGSSYSWTPSSTLDDATSSNPLATPTSTTLYTLTVMNDTCTSTDQVLVSVAGGAQVGFTVRLDPRCEGLRAYFTNLSTGAVSYFWDFGDGQTSTAAEPVIDLPYGADLSITLTVTDADGCTASITQTYSPGELSDHTDITVPNVFSPNGDGQNDVFTPITDALLGGCLHMEIFNRWGQKMFESLGNNIIWDGRTVAGEQAIPGVYFYTISLNGMNFEGSLQLMR